MDGISPQYLLADEFQLFLATDSAQKSPRSARADAYFLDIVLHFLNTERKLLHVEQCRLEDFQLLQIWLAKEQQFQNGTVKKAWADPTIEYYSRVLKKFFRKMFDTERIPRNPCTRWKVPKGTPIQRRPMTFDEFEKIKAAAPDWFKSVLQFMYLTGSRGASVAMLTWADVRFETMTIIIKSRKGGLKQLKVSPLYMFPSLFEFLETESLKMPITAGAPVFWGPKGLAVTAQEISSEGSRLIRKVVGLEGVVLYGLRHAVGADLATANVSLELARQAMTHSSVNQTSHYSKMVASKVVGDAMEKIRGVRKDEK